MVEKQKYVLHGIDVVESVGRIDSNFYDLTTSNIVGNCSNVENISVGIKTCGSSLLCNEVKNK